MASNKYSSTNIAELLESQIEAMTNINDMIVGAKIDEAMLKNIVDTVKPISDVFAALGKAAEAMVAMKIPGPVATLKFKLGVKGLITNIKFIAEEIGKLEFDKETAKKVTGVTSCISEIANITGDLTKIGFSAILLTALKPLIVRTIKMIIEINNMLAEAGEGADPASVTAIGGVLADLGKGLLVFVITTMGGAVPLIAMLSLLAVKAFLWLFIKLFSADFIQQIQISIEGIQEMGKAIAVLSLTILLMALTGILIIEAWKEILITMLFVTMTIGLFWLLGVVGNSIKEGNKSLMLIGATLIMLSMTVLLWALTGDLIMEEWKEIFVVAGFVTLAIGVFFILGLAGQKIKQGGMIMLLVALTLVILSLTVLLWAETGDLISEKWQEILIVAGFVVVAIALFFILGLAGQTIKEGSLTMLIVAAALFLLSATVVFWAWTGGYVMEHWLEVLIMGVFVAVAIGLFFLLSMAIGTVATGGVTALLLVGCLILLGLTAMLYVKAGEQIAEGWENVLYVSLFIAAMAAMLSGLAFALPLIAVGMIALGLIGAGLLAISMPMMVFGKAMESIAATKVSTDQMLEPIYMMKTLVNTVVREFGWRMMIRLWRAVGRMWALLSIATALGKIAEVMQKIASLNIPTAFDKDGNPTQYTKMTSDDFMTAAANAAGIASILANIFGDDPVTVEIGGKAITINPISKSALENITWSTKWKMSQLAQITQAIGTMAQVLQNIASLTVPDPEKGFDKEGKPLGYLRMTAKDFAEAGENAANIAILLSSIFDEKPRVLFIGGKAVLIRNISQDALDNITWRARAKMERLSEITTAIGNMANVLQNIASLNLPTDFDKDGKPIAFRSMNAADFAIATANVGIIMTVLLRAVGNEEITQTLEQLDSDAAENFATVLKGCEGLKFLMDAIKDSVDIDDQTIATGIGNIRTALSAYVKILNDLFIGESEWIWKRGWLGIPYPSLNVIKPPEIDIDDLEDAKDSLSVVVDAINATVPIMDQMKTMSENSDAIKVDQIAEVIKSYLTAVYGDEQGQGGIPISGLTFVKKRLLNDLVTQHERIAAVNVETMKKNTDNFVRFIDKANSIDVDKIQSVRDMMAEMARFSESVHGDFEALADVLSEKLVDILEKLHGTLVEIQAGSPVEGGGSEAPVETGDQPKSPTDNKDKQDKAKELQDKKNWSKLLDSVDGLEGLLGQIRTAIENNNTRY